jgi:hypothetical protein
VASPLGHGRARPGHPDNPSTVSSLPIEIARDEPGDDESAANPLAALRPSATARLRMACSTEIIVINTHADWTCSGESSIAAAFRGGSGVEPDRSAKAAPRTRPVIAAPTRTLRCEYVRLRWRPTAARSA